MKRITGLILVKETGLGVANLVVAVFDSDAPGEDAHNELRLPQMARGLGRRLSSVLTDRDGRFNLSTTDLEFAGNEPRPDLLLVVLAPEDVQDLRRPFPHPMEERILYVSAVPRVEAGAEEAYVIRLMQAQIDQFQIPTGPPGQDSRLAVWESCYPVLRALEVRDGIRARLGERLRAETQKVAAARRAARARVKRLSALPPGLRDEKAQQEALLILGKAQLATLLPDLQAKSIADGLAQMSRPDAKPSLRLRLSDDDLADLGLELVDENVSVEVPTAALSQKLRSMVNMFDLVRVRDLKQPSLEELQRKYLTSPASDDGASPIA